MERTVTAINAAAPQEGKIRTAAYCRVSSDSANQLHSFSAQVRYYTRLIGDNECMELVDIYADEGAARLNENYGGGSLTALPIIETQAGDVSAYIPTNVISITDGQIYLESELFNAGVRPAVNPGISVSRVGGNAQIKAMKKVAGTLKLDYSQYRELQSFAQFGSDLDKDTKDRLAKGERIVEVLKQDQNSPLEVEEQVVIIYAVINNFLKDIAVDKIKQYQADLLDHIKSTCPDILTSIKTEKVMKPEIEEQLKKVLADFAKGYAA